MTKHEDALKAWRYWLTNATPYELIDQLVLSAQAQERDAHSGELVSSAAEEVQDIRTELGQRFRTATWFEAHSFLRTEDGGYTVEES